MRRWLRTDNAHSSIVMDTPRQVVKNSFLEYAKELRFPWLLAITVIIFVIDLIVPDIIPLVDEVLLGLLAVLLSSLKKRRRAEVVEGQSRAIESKPEEKPRLK